ncbi:hypothetical protein EYF80_052247 [Liparis tanakae]|uniref:C-type lectin domain-containing protein n=1 Tax=Liparis tanakae TaxID=230148 RepID=A0A4Z2F8U5_9TELE|nr:hypothetical protein EYF80_052247 [Liparis tanakae]
MEEELHYVTVTFKSGEKPSDLEIIYDEVTTCKEQPSDTDLNTPDDKKEAPRCTLLYLVAAGLGIICVLLVSAVVTVTIYCKSDDLLLNEGPLRRFECSSDVGAAMSEQRRENIHLEDQNRHMWTIEKNALERQNQELTRERDRLHWTVAVILDFENFPVNSRCPQKVCTPCLDGWLLFQSHCYLVTTSTYYSEWRTFWKAQQAGYRPPCGLILPGAEPLANWNEASCTMKNRWICETRALIKSD